jgi:hypothetical protein
MELERIHPFTEGQRTGNSEGLWISLLLHYAAEIAGYPCSLHISELRRIPCISGIAPFLCRLFLHIGAYRNTEALD